MKEVKVSVIVPVYNMEKYLVECLDSILAQTLDNIEIICVDDGSTDNSLNILASYEEEHKNVIVLHQANQGAGMARNSGMDVALGEFIAFMDADDYYPENDVLELLYSCAKRESVNVCGGGLVDESEGRRSQRSGYGNSFSKEQIVDYKDYQYTFGFYRFIYKASMLKDYEIRFPSYPRFEDPPFMMEAMICAKRFYAVARDVYVYRKSDKVVSLDKFEVVNGIAKGLNDNLLMSNKHGLEKAHGDIVLNYLLNTYIYNFYKSVFIGNAEMLDLLSGIAEHINEDLLRKDGRITSKPRLLSESEITSTMRELKERELKFRKHMDEFENIVIYGAGRMGKTLCDYIEKAGYTGNIDFGVSAIGPEGTACGRKMRNISEYISKQKKTLVLVAVKGEMSSSMIEKARELGYENVDKVEYSDLQLYGTDLNTVVV